MPKDELLSYRDAILKRIRKDGGDWQLLEQLQQIVSELRQYITWVPKQIHMEYEFPTIDPDSYEGPEGEPGHWVEFETYEDIDEWLGANEALMDYVIIFEMDDGTYELFIPEEYGDD